MLEATPSLLALRAAVARGALGILLLLGAACHGTLTVAGTLWPPGDDDSAADDDDATTPPDDDDATTPPDDDDDSTGGPVSCGPDPDEPGPAWDGVASASSTGHAEIDFEYGARGALFSAAWTGCEARHYFYESGEYRCGILWEASGASYGEQYGSSAVIVRFAMFMALSESTCGSSHPDAEDRDLYFRLSLPFEDGEAELRWSNDESAPASQMPLWALVPWEGQGLEPDDVVLDYRTAFSADDSD
jgi:hypothetical protein